MVGRTVNNTLKSQKHSQVEVVIDWQHTQEITPAFRRLMMRLLEPRSIQAETKNEEKYAKEQHCPGGE
jgi:hypothetical protein